jgi:L-ascorbate metabolism protein UlaG (beta-lactamase superfamily)
VDVLLIPVGGNYTIDARVATAIYEALSPGIVIPMHFKNARCPDFPVAGVEEFIKGKTNVTSLEGSEVEIKTGAIPADTRIVVLTPAR